ncbi:MAG TPA: dephospho-CoA kinase [Candidatus Binatia bacterium]|nr:dephospho-CoA kinase [Candidatus Binatia bacterium]
MLRVGLTGGIACGKSLVARFFRERGVPVVDDDQAARDAVAPGTPGLAAVVAEFGEGVLLHDGTLDRAALGRTIFADDRLRRRLMNATFPFIGQLVVDRIAAAERSGSPIVVYESALLVENGQVEAWRPLVVVTTSPELQRARLCARNALTPEQADDRIRSQMPLAEKVARADYVIENAASEAAARARFDEVFSALEQRARRGDAPSQ